MTSHLLIPLFSLGWLALSLRAPAAAPPLIEEPTELTELRKQFTLKALASALTLSEQFTNALSTFEKEAGAAGDYEQALSAQLRRLELSNLYNQFSEDPTFSRAIILKPASARLSNGVAYDRSQDTLTGWKAMGNSASWDVTRLAPGSYDVILRYGVAPMGDSPVRYSALSFPDLTTGGEIEFFEDSSLAGAAGNRRTAQLSTTEGWNVIVPMRLPPLQLGRTSARFTIRVTKPRGSGGVMVLKEIRLTPAMVIKTVPPPEGQLSARQEYATLRNAHTEAVKQVAVPIIANFFARLGELAEGITADHETDVAEDIRAEQRRLQRILDNPSPAMLGRIVSAEKKLLNTGNEEWKGVQYVASPANTGDHFMVAYLDERVMVKLIGISCPPFTKDDKVTSELEEHANYFSISTEDVRLLSARARDFTLSFLNGKSFKLLSRGVKDKDGVIPVTLLLDGVGDFAAVLVDNGLAAIAAPKTKSKDALFAALQEREAAAKARRVPIGAWAMRLEDSPPSQ